MASRIQENTKKFQKCVDRFIKEAEKAKKKQEQIK